MDGIRLVEHPGGGRLAERQFELLASEATEENG